MSNIDKQALREAANAANAASWGNWESYKPHKGARGYEVKVGVKAVAQHCLKVDSVFIAAANPATVLALLDELESEHAKSDGLANTLRIVNASNAEMAEALEAAEKRIAELERDETQLIKERDSAEQALADMYEAAMGNRPEWSNLFGYAEAIDDVAQHINLLDLTAAAGKGE